MLLLMKKVFIILPSSNIVGHEYCKWALGRTPELLEAKLKAFLKNDERDPAPGTALKNDEQKIIRY